MSGPAVYLDYAATSAIRPPEVVEAVAGYLREIGATPGRSGHRRAVAAGRVALRSRRLLAELFGIPGDPGRIAFQLNATHALNTALWGVLSPGQRVVRSAYDHNAVRRPVAALVMSGVRESVVAGQPEGDLDLDEVERLLQGKGEPARLLAVPHASNVTGRVLPVREMAERARSVGALVLVDVAQTAGHHPVDVEALGADLVAFTGHKGLLGPQGIGGLWVREGVPVEPLLRGGTGGDSAPAEMPSAYPDHLEAGTQNAPGMAGLAAGVEWLLRQGVESLRRQEHELKAALVAGLRQIPGLRLLSAEGKDTVGIVTFICDWAAPVRLATLLDREFGIEGRAGLHCAPEVHQAMGTFETGAVRLSLGWASTPRDVERALRAVRELHERLAGDTEGG